MRKIKIDNTLIENVKYALDETECNGALNFDEYWKSLNKKEMVDAVLDINYYDQNCNDPIEDFYEKAKYNEKDNTIDFEITEHANIFLKRIYYLSGEILRIERREKLEIINKN